MSKINIPLRADQPATYEIVLQGRLDSQWSNWFSEMTVASESSSDGAVITTLTGQVADQTALYGVLSRIRDLGLPLLSVTLLNITDTHETPTVELPGYPSRMILEGVPRVGYDVHLSPFPGALFAILQYLKDPVDYDYIMGVTGAAFRRFWNRDDGGNVDISYLGDAPFEYIFKALGYTWQKISDEKDAMTQAFIKSINLNIPAISFGIYGPPEAGIVTGYDKDGVLLYGWSCFQENGAQYYERSDWYETMVKGYDGKGAILLGEKTGERPSPKQILIQSLEWAIDLERTSVRPGRPDHVCGLAAYDGWANGMEVDADYPPDNRDILNTRVMVHGDQCVMLQERHSAACYLRQMVKVAPDVSEHLNAAAILYDEVGNIVSQVYPWTPWHEKAFEGLANPEMRREFAQLIRLAKEKETRAVEYLEIALKVLSNQ
jgi:hypothetical protein